MRNAVFLAAVFSLAIGRSALADSLELPHFDVPRHCKTVAGFGGSYSEMIYGGCLQMEQASYDGLKAEWAHLDDAPKRHCLQVSRFGGDPSYMILSGCVQMERNAAEQNARKRFRY